MELPALLKNNLSRFFFNCQKL